MCIAILQPRNKRLKRKTLKACWDNNPNGGGFMYALDGKIVVVKELEKFDSFYSQFHNHRTKHNVDFILHFRIATHGLIDEKNAHPHQANFKTWFVHNGIISQKCDTKSSLSDTVKFAKLLSKLETDFMLNDSVLELVREYIDTDKIIFLNNQGKIRIVNKSLGVKKYGCWFSNSTYQRQSGYFWSGYAHGGSTAYSAYNNGNWKDYTVNQTLGTDYEICDSCSKQITIDEFDELSALCLGCAEREQILAETARLEHDGHII